MKKPFSLLLLILLYAYCSFSFADYDDGYITEGEYEHFVEWDSYNPPLIVEGGGANWIEIRDYGRIEVLYTSIPIEGDWHTGGIRDLFIDDTHLKAIEFFPFIKIFGSSND